MKNFIYLVIGTLTALIFGSSSKNELKNSISMIKVDPAKTQIKEVSFDSIKLATQDISGPGEKKGNSQNS